VTESRPNDEEGTLHHWIVRNAKTNRSHAHLRPKGDGKEAILDYRVLGASTNYTLVEVDLKTGRHHQIRAQLSAVGCVIKGDLKYGAKRSNKDGSISLHSRRVEFAHPVGGKMLSITAPVPNESLWKFFEEAQQ
jgi:23S rRNA pseudouridine1911/1915/1917 synthase